MLKCKGFTKLKQPLQATCIQIIAYHLHLKITSYHSKKTEKDLKGTDIYKTCIIATKPAEPR